MQTFPKAGGALLLALFACDPGSRPGGEPEKAAPAAKPEPAQPSPLARSRQDVTKHMPNHFASARDLADAMVDGDLEAAKKASATLAGHQPRSMPADWFPYLERMRAAARDVQNAGDLAAAATATGQVVLACGSCHAGQGKGPAVPDVPMPATEGDSCMVGHRWATDRLWFGVVADNEGAWKAGAGSFAARPECPKKEGDPIADPDVFEKMRVKLQEQARAAGDAADLEARARTYGEMLVTCGTCHVSGC